MYQIPNLLPRGIISKMSRTRVQIQEVLFFIQQKITKQWTRKKGHATLIIRADPGFQFVPTCDHEIKEKILEVKAWGKSSKLFELDPERISNWIFFPYEKQEWMN